ncbi:enoyl-CoA hydratase-related protein [Ideonella sp.]|uniref:enoyl-CoA hydratase-related protein n=1 Tax=Ideonella sp. TaxID=1929293 RepID=UPI002B459F21|nr:enoyl-CoA hydratase-related protein [Ideonella sp.]HJV68258.1 enoyl-CoA hydratase-related protein [Ideonella sp.]
MRILLLSHSFNSLTQRLHGELGRRGHVVSVELDIADSVTEEAVTLFRPDVLVAPFLKRRIPESVWRALPCLVVHPGIPGDRGPSALDRAVLRGEAEWGVTVLQADGEFDAGPVRAWRGFPMREAAKGSLYRHEVTCGAVEAVLEAIGLVGGPPAALAALRGQPWPLLRQAERAIDWARHGSAEVLRRIRSGDGNPGLADALFGQACHLFDAHPVTPAALAAAPPGAPGEVVARRANALLRRTVDGGVWIGHARRAPTAGPPDDEPPLKLPATDAFTEQAAALPELPVPLRRDAGEWDELHYEELGPPGARVGVLAFEFYNGAMSTRQCRRLRDALGEARRRDTQVLLLTGGADFFSNGIHLNTIEAAAQREGDSAADESMRNIEAIDDVALEIISMTDRVTIAAMRGNAGAGGVFLALAADEVWAHEGVVLNAHYRNMGNLYGSEYWTYLLPRRIGPERAQALMHERLPLGARAAAELGLIDVTFGSGGAGFLRETLARAQALAGQNLISRLAQKQQRRAADEATKPLAEYRREELAQMHRNFYGFDPSYHVARYHFVHKLAHAWTPRHLAVHRKQ